MDAADDFGTRLARDPVQPRLGARSGGRKHLAKADMSCRPTLSRTFRHSSPTKGKCLERLTNPSLADRLAVLRRRMVVANDRVGLAELAFREGVAGGANQFGRSKP